jgi:CelD/BcsL family acetyltransferase involved in cellulose biosynthesis
VMEQSGWKGRKGTAAAQSQSVRSFYSELARSAAGQDYLSLYFLTLDGKPIASQYGLIRDGVYSLLLTSYDESFKEHSPGHLLMEEVVKACSSAGLREIDFLGCDLDWKLDWSSFVRNHYWLFIFRSNRIGRALRRAKFEWIPAAKKRLGG